MFTGHEDQVGVSFHVTFSSSPNILLLCLSPFSPAVSFPLRWLPGSSSSSCLAPSSHLLSCPTCVPSQAPTQPVLTMSHCPRITPGSLAFKARTAWHLLTFLPCPLACYCQLLTSRFGSDTYFSNHCNASATAAALSQLSLHLSPLSSLASKNCWPHLTDEETEAHREERTLLGVWSTGGYTPKLADCTPRALSISPDVFSSTAGDRDAEPCSASFVAMCNSVWGQGYSAPVRNVLCPL